MSHVLWECSTYSNTTACFIKKLQELLEDEYEDFESLDKVEKSSYVLGSELWKRKFDRLLSLVKDRCVANTKASIIIMIVTQDPVNNSILGLHMWREMVSSIKMVSLFRMVSLVRIVS